MSRPRTVVFDLDGTLVHSAPDLHAAANVALRSLGRDELSLAAVISFVGNGVAKLVERALHETGGWTEDLQQQALAAFMDHYARNTTTLTRPYPGVMACLDRLKDADVAMGICTNKPETPARQICQDLGLASYFDVISGARSDRPRKPDPAMLLDAARALGADPDKVVYVGDSRVDFETARNAGITFLLFSRGYLNHPLPEQQKHQIFDSWDDFPRVLDGVFQAG